MKYRKTIARTVFLLYIAAVLYLCFADFSNSTEVPRQIFGFDTDKVVHFLMFFPFPILFYLAFCRDSKSFLKSVALVLCILALGCLIAAGTEYAQSFLPYRTGDQADFRADFLALGISSAIVLIKDLIRTARNA